jgi:RNA recognition motif-containing protein
MLPKTIDEEDLHNMFAPYGELREVHIIRGPEGSSKGCAFVKFVDREAAMVAIEDMNELIPPVTFLCQCSKYQTYAISNNFHFSLQCFRDPQGPWW